MPQPAAVIAPENIETLALLGRWGKGPLRQVVYSPDGRLLAILSASGVSLYDTDTLEELHSLAPPDDSGLWSVSFSPDGGRLAALSGGGTVWSWRVEDLQPLGAIRLGEKTFSSAATILTFSPDGTFLATNGGDGVALWRVSDGSLVREFSEHAVVDLAFSPDGATLALGEWGNSLALYDLSDAGVTKDFTGSEEPGSNTPSGALAFAPRGDLLAYGETDGSILLLRPSDGSVLRRLEGHEEPATKLAFSPDGHILASGGYERSIYLWRVSDGAVLRRLNNPRGEVESLVFSPSGGTLAVGSFEGLVRLWRVRDGSLKHYWVDFTNEITSLAFSPTGYLLATGSSKDATIRFWRMDEGESLRIFGEGWWRGTPMEGGAKTPFVSRMKFSPDGRFLAACDGSLEIWQVTNSAPIYEGRDAICGPEGWALDDFDFSPDGETLAVQRSGEDMEVPFTTIALRLLQLPDGAWTSFQGDLGGRAYGLRDALAFSPDGRTLATAHSQEIDVLRLRDGQHLYTVPTRGRVFHLRYLSGGEILIAGTEEAVQLWRASDGEPLATWDDLGGPVSWISLSPDGQIVALSTIDPDTYRSRATVQLRRLLDGQLLRTLEHPAGARDGAFSPDGRFLAVGTGPYVWIWGVPADQLAGR